MNKIIESTHPNIDNYFKNLLSVQEESYKKEKNRIKEYFYLFYIFYLLKQ